MCIEGSKLFTLFGLMENQRVENKSKTTTFNLDNQTDTSGDESLLKAHTSSMRHLKHRPSVKSLSHFPNIIGFNSGEDDHSDIFTKFLIIVSWFLLVILMPISLFFTFRVVHEYERGLIFN